MRHIHGAGIILLFLLLLIYCFCCNIYAYDSIKPPELYVGVISSNDTYYRDEIIVLNYTIMNRYGTAQDFIDNGRNVIIKIPNNFTFRSISILDQNHNKIRFDNDSKMMQIRLPYSPDNWFATYVNLCLSYNKKSSPVTSNFLENYNCVALNFIPNKYTKHKYYNITILNRLPALNKCIRRSTDGRNFTFVCEGLDLDSEMLVWHILDKNGNELTNYTSSNKNPGKILKPEVNCIDSLMYNDAYSVVLSDDFNTSKNVLISNEIDIWNILYPYLNFIAFILLFILISYFINPNISVLYFMVNRDRLNTHIFLNKYFLLSDLWMVIFTFVFGLGLMDLHFVVDTATVINIIMIFLAILGLIKEKIGGIFLYCIVIIFLFSLMLLFLPSNPIVSKLIIFLSLPSVLHVYYMVHSRNTNLIPPEK